MSHRRSTLATYALGVAASLVFTAGCGAGAGPGGEDIASTHEAFTGATSDVTTAYNDFKASYMETVSWCGSVTPCIRVKRTDQGNDTVSEGMGYGMLMSAYLSDRATFDGLWNLYRTHGDSASGGVLMNWHYNSSGVVPSSNDANEATDAAEDTAIALIVADKRGWGTPAGDTQTYHARAISIINAIFSTMVNGSNQPKPGDAWDPGGNPSYLIAPYATIFDTYAGTTRWAAVKTAEYAEFAALDANNAGANSTGLAPDWFTHAGVPDNCSIANWDTQGGHCRAATVSYDACRTPWRLAMDWSWNNDTRANARLTKINAWARPKAGNIRAGYNLDGSEYPDSTWYADAGIIAAFVGPIAAASVQTGDATYQSTMWTKLNGLGHLNYYSDSIRLYTMMFLSGNMPNPLTIGSACTAETDSAFCSRLGKNCGQVTANDNCGTSRTVSSCGSCTSPATCAGGGTANVCGTASCTAETDSAFCSRLGKNCGQVTANDNCGTSRTVSSCGSCTSPATCGGGGTSNVCGGGSSTNVALTKTATADSAQASNTVLMGNDSSTTSRWCANDGNLNHWWKVDLGGNYNLTGVSVMWERSNTNYKYKVEVSANDSTYSMASDQTATTSTSQTQALSFTASSVRYVRITVTGLPSGTWASFFDFQVYGTASSGCTCADDGNPCTVDACVNNVCTHNAGNAGTVCRGAVGECDVAETCTGSSTSCPTNAFKSSGTTCTGGTCNGTGTCNVASCTAETDSAFCTRLAKNCGSVTANDNCGNSRTVSCGSCTSPATCGGGGTANVCGGGGGTEPCTPSATFGAGVTNSGSFNTSGAYCFRTSYAIAGWGCSNFDGRSLMVNDTTKTCGSMPLPVLYNGYYYFESGAGTYSYASIYWW